MGIKLSKAMQDVMNEAKQEIDYARTHDFLHWIAKTSGYKLETDWDAYPNPYLTNEWALKRAQELVKEDGRGYFDDGIEILPPGWSRRQYEKRKTGIVLTIASSHTLRALETRGLIRIIKDAKRGVDEIQVLNY